MMIKLFNRRIEDFYERVIKLNKTMSKDKQFTVINKNNELECDKLIRWTKSKS